MPPKSRATLKGRSVDKRTNLYTTRHQPEPMMSPTSDLSVATIQTIEADESLQTFPMLLKTQLDEYLKGPEASPKSFTSTTEHFDVHWTKNGEPACFVELGTTNIMDCGHYTLGIIKTASIVVVKPHAGSSFNEGKPAIIRYFGKGKKRANGRNIISRWAVWTPDGIRTDTLVERMITGPPSEDSLTTPATKRRKTLNRKDMKRLSSETNEDADDEALATAAAMERNADRAEEQVVVKQDEDSSGDDIGYRAFGTSQSNTADRSTMTALGEPLFMPKLDMFETGGNSNTTSHPESLAAIFYPTTPLIVPTLPSGAKAVTLEFKGVNEDRPRIIKTIAQCNSVQKLFAYAHKAGISGPDTVLLRASFANSEMYDIVRDDDDDFQELLRIPQRINSSNEKDEVNVIRIESVAY